MPNKVTAHRARHPLLLRWFPIPLLLVVGCAIVDNQDADDAAFRVQANGTHVVLHNDLEERVFYFAVGRQLSFLIDWIPHLDDDVSVAPGETVAIPYADIMMNSDTGETEVVVYWWQAAMRDGKRIPGDIATVVVDI